MCAHPPRWLGLAGLALSSLWSALTFQLVGSAAQTQVVPAFDLVLARGRVMDPETGTDAVRYVGIQDGRIAAISSQPVPGHEQLDVAGRVVAPGFIDLHAHGQNIESNRFQAMDGVTTALELEGGAFPVAEWYASRRGKALIHYGATVGHTQVRGYVLQETLGHRDDLAYLPATDDQLAEIERRIRQGLDEGALGVGYGIQYTPGATREEIFRVFRTATERNVTNFVHVRFAGSVEPGSSIEAIQEVIANAAALGASVHVVHIGSSGLGQVRTVLRMIDGARERGLDITTEVYPYTAASTAIESALFAPGWRGRFEADYQDLEWVSTGERLDEESFTRYRSMGGTVIAHVIPEETVDVAVSHPSVMIASDGVPFVNGRAHPRGMGTFARILGRYVRERKMLTLMQALSKMSLMPARRLEGTDPAFRRKGRVQVGADADIVVFDPERVIDRATFEVPAQYSEGFTHVLVAGTFVVRDSRLVEGVRPGQPMRR